MFVGLYETDESKVAAIKKAIKQIDPKLDILDSNNCLELIWERYYLEEVIKNELGEDVSEEEINHIIKIITKAFLNSDFGSVNEEIEIFILDVLKEYKNSRNK